MCIRDRYICGPLVVGIEHSINYSRTNAGDPETTFSSKRKSYQHRRTATCSTCETCLPCCHLAYRWRWTQQSVGTFVEHSSRYHRYFTARFIETHPHPTRLQLIFTPDKQSVIPGSFQRTITTAAAKQSDQTDSTLSIGHSTPLC